MSLAVLSVGALALAILVSCVTTLNVGVLAVALAWIIGVYVGGIPVNTVMGGFPTSLFLTLTGMTLLFTLAQCNGTLDRLAHHAVRLCRGNRGVIPIMFFLLGAGLAAQGSRLVAARTAFVDRFVRWTLPVAAAVTIALIVTLALPPGFLGRSGTGAPAGSRPNVLFVVLDTVRAENLSLHGYTRHTTPRLDTFAKSGVVFERAITPSPYTLPAHASFFTGRYPRELSTDWLTRLDATYHCPHHPAVTGPCACRKPGVELHRRAAADLGVDLTRSLFVGDRHRDIAPGLELGGFVRLVPSRDTPAEEIALARRDGVLAPSLGAAVAEYLQSTGNPDGSP